MSLFSSRWFRYGLIIFLALLFAALLLLGWFVFEVRSHMDVPTPGPESIVSWAEPAPSEAPTSVAPELLRSVNFDSLASPPQSVRPWARWWWPGGDVSSGVACEQLQQLRNRGFGGVEIQAFNAGLSVLEDEATQARINSFGSDDWHQTLRDVMACAERLDMSVYLNHLSGWPAGGPQVSLEDGLWTLRYGESIVRGGGELDLELPLPAPGVHDYLMSVAEFFIGMELAGFALEQRELVAVVAAQVIGGERRDNPLDATDTLVLKPGSVQVLTDKVVAGQLRWQAPDGEWVIIAAYLMPSAEAPTLVAAENAGYVIDHLSENKLRAHYDYAYGSRTGLPAHAGKAFKGFFNDSLEFKLDRLASQDILTEFSKRRGYDLTPHLPAIFVEAYDNFFIRDVGRSRSAPSFQLSEDDERVRFDYQDTLSDLVIERFVEGSADWAERHNLLSRGQTYGFEMDTIRALGANHIPETEHLWGSSSEVVMKLAGSAALLYERNLVTAESFVWFKRAYAVTPRHIKAGADLLFLSGVNQVIYHGVPYIPEGEAYKDTFGSLGWYPFQGPGNPSGFADNYGPATPTWEALPELNQYISRSQAILQSGKAAVDVLVYYPYLGFPKSIEDSAIAEEALLFAGRFPDEPAAAKEGGSDIPLVTFLPHEKDPRLLWLEKLIPTLRALDAAGITWNWVNGHALESGRVNPDIAQALLIADIAAMPVPTVEALVNVELPVYFMGELPRRQPGFADASRGDARVLRLAADLARERSVSGAEDLVAQVQPLLGIEGAPEIRRVSRRGPQGESYHLLVNRSESEVSGSLRLRVDAAGSKRAYWFDAASGALWPAQADGDAYTLALGPLESRFLLFTDKTLVGKTRPLSVQLRDAVAQDGTQETVHKTTTIELSNLWTLTIGDSVQEFESSFPLIRELPYLSGKPIVLVYETSFEIDEMPPGKVLLDFGGVVGIAQVEINGESLPLQSFDPFLFDVSNSVQQGRNKLKLTITPPLRNSLVASGLMDGTMEQFKEQLSAVGLKGPVRVHQLHTTETTLEEGTSSLH